MPKKTKKSVLTGQSRELVLRLRNYFERERDNGGPFVPIHQVVDRVADALDIGKSTVSRITKEKYGQSGMEENELETPNTKRIITARVTGVDSTTDIAIRNHIHDYYRRNELPTLAKLTKSLKDAELFTGSLTSVWRVLHQLGFIYKKVNNKTILMQRTDVITDSCLIIKAINLTVFFSTFK